MPRGAKRRRATKNEGSACDGASSSADVATERLSDPSHAETVLKGLERLWRNGVLCDLTLRCCDDAEEPVEVEVHSAVVAAVSAPLEQMLVGPMASVEDGVLTLGPGVDGDSLRSVVEFIYTGELKVTETTTWSVLEATSYLDVVGAKSLTAGFLGENLSPDNALGMVAAADRFGCPELLKEARELVAENFEVVSQQEEFLALSKEEILSYAELHTLRVSGEMVVVEALVRWTEHAKAEREAGFVEMFGNKDVVRLPHLSLTDLEAVGQAAWASPFIHLLSQESLRRANNEPDPSRPRRYLPPPSGSFAVPTACERTLTDHRGGVKMLMPLGANKIVSCSTDRTIKVWDTTSLACERTLQAPAIVQSLELIGDLLFAGLFSGLIMVWSTTSWTHVRSLEGHTQHTLSLVAWGDKFLISCSYDKTIRVWSTTTWTCERTLTDHSDNVNSLVMFGDKLASGSDDNTIKLWNTTSWTCECTLAGHTGSVVGLAYNGGKLLSSSGDHTVKIWDTTSWACERTLQFESGVRSFIVRGDFVVAGFYNGVIEICSLYTGEKVRRLEGHERWVFSLTTLEGKLFSACDDHTIKVWNS